ncbi:IS630 family transposase, partial [Desulfovibrio sp. ZJ369]|uniref:IS630 family transposase n=1 Tax=Desulfovibrio sp. ZJ369 TaxID=2709793 RepID=UPI0019810129
WKLFQQKASCNRLIFIDETGAKTNMTRLYGRARNGQRCHDHASDGRWERISILSATRVTGETCSAVFDGALDGKMYNAYIEKFLLPTLKANDIVIMDNLNIHKSKTAKNLITEKGCKYIFLPEYSPDLNPIEKMWSKVKQLLRGMKAKTCDELYKSIGKALSCITQKDAEGWFKSCGYVKS